MPGDDLIRARLRKYLLKAKGESCIGCSRISIVKVQTGDETTDDIFGWFFIVFIFYMLFIAGGLKKTKGNGINESSCVSRCLCRKLLDFLRQQVSQPACNLCI